MSSRSGGALLPWWIALPIVAFLDLLDIALVGLFPGLGEPLDALAIAINFITVGPIALVGVAEFASLTVVLAPVEVVPFHTIALIAGLMLKS
jgi:hypothetical protein